MERNLKQFVRKIVLFHVALLAILLAVVSGAANHVYQTARRHALNQAQERQMLLATQTARGVSGFYDSILSDLNLVKPEEEEASDLPDSPRQGTDLKPPPLAVLAPVRHAISMLLTRQLQGRAYLFMVDEQLHPRALGADDHAARPGAGQSGFVPDYASTQGANFEQQLISHFGPWLQEQQSPAISPLQVIDQRSIKLICVPLLMQPRTGLTARPSIVARRSGWLAAAVSAKPIETGFLAPLSRDVSDAFLVDDSMTVMACSHHDLVGTRLDETTAPGLMNVLSELHHGNYTGTRQLSERFAIASENYDPAMITACPVDVMGKQWFILLASPLSQVDAVVRDFSIAALGWAIFVAVSVTAILVSTAAQVILSRMRMERSRHKQLQNEMRQARQIQLAWLPPKTKMICGASIVDIASFNRPATHISGDFYNFFELPDGRTAVVIGDVTGHGTAAAFLMAVTQLLIRNSLPQYCDPGKCLEDVNRQLANQVFNGQFVTLQIVVIDPNSGEAMIATAGHPAPLVHDGENCQPLKIEPQLVAGVDPRMVYPTEHFRLLPGSSLLLYTDGVVETEDPSGARLRLDGLGKALCGEVNSAELLLHRAVAAVNTFRRGRDFRDDLTVVAVHLLNRSGEIEAEPEVVAPEPVAIG